MSNLKCYLQSGFKTELWSLWQGKWSEFEYNELIWKATNIHILRATCMRSPENEIFNLETIEEERNKMKQIT